MNTGKLAPSTLRGFLAATAVLVLGIGAVTVPWLTVRNSVGDGREDLRTANASRRSQDRAGKIGVGSVAAGRSPQLLLFPVPEPPRPRLASAPAFATPVPDPGSVMALKKSLRALSYLVGPDDGNLDPATRFGLTAFQKVEGLPVTGAPDPPTLDRLASAQRPAPAYNTPPDHLEVDVRRQVVFVVTGGQVTETITTSTGNGQVFRSQGRRSRAVTPNGQYAITYKRNGWRRSPLGLLYRPAYFNGGIAFHGAKSVPNSPASHGCVRLPMPFADWFAEHASPVGKVVYVYGNPGEANPAPVTSAPVPAGAPPPEAIPGAEPPPPPPPPPPPGAPILGGLIR